MWLTSSKKPNVPLILSPNLKCHPPKSNWHWYLPQNPVPFTTITNQRYQFFFLNYIALNPLIMTPSSFHFSTRMTAKCILPTSQPDPCTHTSLRHTKVYTSNLMPTSTHHGVTNNWNIIFQRKWKINKTERHLINLRMHALTTLSKR